MNLNKFSLVDQNNQSGRSNAFPASFYYEVHYNCVVNGANASLANSAVSVSNTGKVSQSITWANTATYTDGLVLLSGTFISAAQEDVENALPSDRKSTRLNSSHIPLSRMPSSA